MTAAAYELMRSGCKSTKSPNSNCHTTPGPASSPTTARSCSTVNDSPGRRISICCFNSPMRSSTRPSSLSPTISSFSSLNMRGEAVQGISSQGMFAMMASRSASQPSPVKALVSR